ncbi:MAG: hypothetical protein JWQ07_4092 [Ramlibacter sp.]|nr:hypothetical protein [Ramlibacter sp.]
MHAFTHVFYAMLLAALVLTPSVHAQSDRGNDPSLSPELLQELATGGTKGVGADCSFIKLANCRLPTARVQSPMTRPAAPSATPTANTAPLTVASQGGYTGLRFGWQHEDGRPAARDHRFKTSDFVKLWVEVAEPGYVYLVSVDAANKPMLLWPMGGDRNYVSPDLRAITRARFVGKPGVERVYALFTRERLDGPEVFALHAHRVMTAPTPSTMNIQFAVLDREGRMSESGVIVSDEGRARSKGLMGVGTNFEARQSNSVTADPGGVALVERALVERFPVQVLSLDLIHVSP